MDAVWLLDAEAGVFVDCNQAAVDLSGAENKQQLLRVQPDEFSPPFQLDGTPSAEKSAEIIAIIQRDPAHRFEWLLRRRDGRDIPIEVSATALLMTAIFPLPHATSSTSIPGRNGSRAMNSSATVMIVFATCPKSPDSQVVFWRALMAWSSAMFM